MAVFVFSPSSSAAGASDSSAAPGITEGQRQIDKPIEPPMEAHSRKMNVDQVKKEAEELKKLADGVPAQIELVTKNQYQKDLTDNLKRIERLAKHLRSEITP